MIKDGVDGFLIDRNAAALADALEKLKDPELRREMGDNFYEEIMKNWTWKIRIKDFRRMFEMSFERYK